MKTLKNILTKLTLLFFFAILFQACKKDKDEDANGNNSFTYLGKTNKITMADYRGGDGDGAWIYFSGEGYEDYVQIRFSKLRNYEIPIGTFSYSPLTGSYNAAKNFSGGMITSSAQPLGDGVTGGTVTVSKDGDSYTINVDATTSKGKLTASFTGVLTKI